CKNCGYLNAENTKFCENCGADLIEAKVPEPGKTKECKNCGYLNAENTKFCENCGADLTEPKIPEPEKTK
ncbi:zinc-ribbon domain-containing protein, partial [Ligilactobacillus salivarius]